MALKGITNLEGRLAFIYSILNPDTIQHASEIMNDRRLLRKAKEREELRNTWVLTADSALYTVEDREPILYFGDRDSNLIFRYIEIVIGQSIRNRNYRPGKKDVQSVIDSVSSGKVLRINLYDLATGERDSKFNRFDISTSGFDSLNNVQRKFAEKVCGSGKGFVKNMKMLNTEGEIDTMGIYFMSPEYVIKNAGRSPIVRACWLSSFHGSSDFYAGSRDIICDNYVMLRGKPKSNDARKIVTLYHKLEAETEILLKAYVDTDCLSEAKGEMRRLYNVRLRRVPESDDARKIVTLYKGEIPKLEAEMENLLNVYVSPGKLPKAKEGIQKIYRSQPS